MTVERDEYNNPDYYPYEHKRAEPPTKREWIFCLILLVLGLALSAIPIIKQEISVDQAQVK